MFSKCFFAVLMLSIIFLAGCYSSETLQADKVKGSLDYNKVTIIITEDNGTTCQYQLLKNNPGTIKNDTLLGKALKISEDTELDKSKIYNLKIPVSKIKYMEVENFSTSKTILLTAGIAGAVAIIAAISSNGSSGSSETSGWLKSDGTFRNFSCPLIYTLGDEGYKLESETFAGAVFKGIERTSYDILSNIKPIKGVYKMRLVNAREETEYVNKFKLITVDHSPDVSIIPNAAGKIHTISNLIRPINAFNKNGDNIINIINNEDERLYESNLENVDVNNEKDLVDYVTVTFPKPLDAESVKIIVSGLNTKLAYFALEKIFAFQGNKRISWYNCLDSDTTERTKFIQWLTREGMLHFAIWNGETWSERGVVPDVGPGVEKTQITILNLFDIPGDKLIVKASFRTGLWRLNNIAVDYSSDSQYKIQELSSISAINEKGENISSLIAESDSSYYVTFIGNQADICFPVPKKAHEHSRTIIALTKGFYNQWGAANEKTEPQIVDQILTESFFGSKFLIPLWLKEHSNQ